MVEGQLRAPNRAISNTAWGRLRLLTHWRRRTADAAQQTLENLARPRNKSM